MIFSYPSISHRLKGYFFSSTRERWLRKAIKLIEAHGCDADKLYLVNPLAYMPEEKFDHILRFFRIPMSLGYLLRNKLDMDEDLLDMLDEILKFGLIHPIDYYPLRMVVDRPTWDFYKNINEMTKPLEVQLNITNRCVNKCHMCRKYEWPQIDMPVVKLREIVADLKEMGVATLILSGGEPFLHSDIDEIIDIVSDMSTLVFTSGVVPVSINKLKKLKKVQFSVDALDPEIYRIIRGPGNIGTIKENILRAKDAGCDVTVTAVIQKANIFHIPDIIEFCERMDIPFLPGAVHSYNELSFYNINNRILPSVCVVPFYHCLIDPIGDVFVCCHHHEDNADYNKIDRNYILGNVFKNSFSNIWYSDRASEIKMRLLKNRTHFCMGCYRYLLQNDVASFIMSCNSPPPLPFTHTYSFHIELMESLRI